MNVTNLSNSDFSPSDLYYSIVTSNIFLYGYFFSLSIGFVGNTCQIITFSRKSMRRISTTVLFLALSISDLLYLLINVYILIVYGFQQADRSNLDITCRIRHFTIYFTKNFSAWMLMTISCDRWIRTQFPMKSQRICTCRMAVRVILLWMSIDIVLHVHLLSPLFGPVIVNHLTMCGPNAWYTSYHYFYSHIWPILTTFSVGILPSLFMVGFLTAIIINIRTRQNQIRSVQQFYLNSIQKRRSHFIHRQMFILMIVTLLLFFMTTLPCVLYRVAISTFKIQQPFALSLLIYSVFDLLATVNHAFNFYLHCLTSKFYRKEFIQFFSFLHRNKMAQKKGLLIRKMQKQRF